MQRRHAQAQREAKTTVLIVGEGDTEKAFLDHLKLHYVTRGCGVSVTTRNAHGKGPENVVDVAIKHARGADYSIVAVLMDTDLPWCAPQAGTGEENMPDRRKPMLRRTSTAHPGRVCS